MEESHHYKKHAAAEAEAAAAAASPASLSIQDTQESAGRAAAGFLGQIRRTFATLWTWRVMLLGAAGSWFIFDIGA
jgi:hypothetical protein